VRKLFSWFVAVILAAAFTAVGVASTAKPASANQQTSIATLNCTAQLPGIPTPIGVTQPLEATVTGPTHVRRPTGTFHLDFKSPPGSVPTSASGATVFYIHNLRTKWLIPGNTANPQVPSVTLNSVEILTQGDFPSTVGWDTTAFWIDTPGPIPAGTEFQTATYRAHFTASGTNNNLARLRSGGLTTTAHVQHPFSNGGQPTDTATSCPPPTGANAVDFFITQQHTNPVLPPVVDAGPNASGDEDTAIALTGSSVSPPYPTPAGANPPPNNDPEETWTINSPDCTFSAPTSPTTDVTCTEPGTFTATLTADDYTNAPVSDTVTVTVNDVVTNTPPVVDAGADVSGDEDTPIALDGTVTDDGSFTSDWDINSAGCSFADETAVDTTVTCADPGVYTATLTADDGVNPPVSDTATVTVNDVVVDNPPIVDAGADVSGDEDTTIDLVGQVSDDGPFTVDWDINSAGCSFADESEAVTTVTCADPGVYTATLTADDGVNPPVSDTTTVTVDDVNIAPTVDAGSDVSGDEDTAIALDGTVTDPDNTPSILWTINNVGCDFANDNAIDTSVTCADPGVYTATLTADDGVNPPVSDTATVTVDDVNIAPIVSAGGDVGGDEDTAIPVDGTVTDPDNTPSILWTINNAGCNFANANAVDTSVTCADPGVYTATLTADDGVNPPVSDTTTVTVTDVIEPVGCTGLCIRIGDAAVYEGGVSSLPVTLSQAAPADMTITATINAGTATNCYQIVPAGSPCDFKSPFTKTVKIKAGQVKAFVNAPTSVDGSTESDESYTVTLSNASAGTIETATGTATIRDTNGPGAGQILIGDVTIDETDSGTKVVAKIAVVLSAPSAVDVSVSYSTIGLGGALGGKPTTIGADFQEKLNKTLVFRAGQTKKFVSVIIFGDNDAEAGEGVQFQFSNPTGGYALGFGTTGTVTIRDND
jgi:hypothetical protein